MGFDHRTGLGRFTSLKRERAFSVCLPSSIVLRANLAHNATLRILICGTGCNRPAVRLGHTERRSSVQHKRHFQIHPVQRDLAAIDHDMLLLDPG